MRLMTLLGILFMLATTLEAKPSHHILIYGHRGARGLAPENSIPAYKDAIAIGVDYVDMDVNMTKDGIVVVAHNSALNPQITRDENGRWVTKPILLKNLTFKQLQAYDIGRLAPNTAYAETFPDQIPVDGTTMPSLKQVIQYVKIASHNKVNFQVEIKTDPSSPKTTFPPKKIAKATLAVLKEEGVDTRTELQAFDWRILTLVQKLDPNIATAYLTSRKLTAEMTSSNPIIAGRWTDGHLLKNYQYSIPKMIASLGGKVWCPESKQLNAKLVDEAHQYGLKVVVWTVNDVSEMNRMINLGVDGIITDRPDILREVLVSYFVHVPKRDS